MTLKIAWGITGSGDYLEESVTIMQTLCKKYDLNIEVILSKAGEKVVTWYKLLEKVKQNSGKVFIESDANTPFLVGPLQLGKYNIFLICPATANTTAKIAHGIADSLLTNCAAQAIKAGMHVYIYPVDQVPGEVVTNLPNGKKLALQVREVDVENAETLKRMKGITVLTSPNDIEKVIQNLQK
jgi:archaeoflavoprotein AfpA